MDNSIIQDLGLTKEQVNQIVLEWYTCGMFPYILQDEDGYDLEELLEE